MSDLETLIRTIIRDELGKLRQPANDEYLSTADAADLARVRPSTIRRWVRAKRLSKIGGARRVLVKREDLERLITGGVIDTKLSPAERARRRMAR